MDSFLKDCAAFADHLASLSGPVVMQGFRSDLEIIDKDDDSPVTRADRDGEAALRAAIEAQYPNHGIVGEEYGRANDDATYVWVLDPIDGTRSFIAGIPLFGTLIALCRDGEPVVGVIDHPALGERWVGVAGGGTTLNGRPIKTRPCAGLAAATVFCTAPEMFDGGDGDKFQACAARAKQVRYGTDCYGYAMVASGYGDATIEGGMAVYDFAALRPVVEGAGGVISDWDGAPLTLASPGGSVLAAGDARVHAEAQAVLGAVAGA